MDSDETTVLVGHTPGGMDTSKMLKMFCFCTLYHWELREGEDRHNSLCFSLPPYCIALPSMQLISQHSGHPLCDCLHPGIFLAPHCALILVIKNNHINTEISTDMHPSLEPHLQVQWHLNISLASLRLSTHKNDHLITEFGLSYYHFLSY